MKGGKEREKVTREAFFVQLRGKRKKGKGKRGRGGFFAQPAVTIARR